MFCSNLMLNNKPLDEWKININKQNSRRIFNLRLFYFSLVGLLSIRVHLVI